MSCLAFGPYLVILSSWEKLQFFDRVSVARKLAQRPNIDQKSTPKVTPNRETSMDLEALEKALEEALES